MCSSLDRRRQTRPEEISPERSTPVGSVKIKATIGKDISFVTNTSKYSVIMAVEPRTHIDSGFSGSTILLLTSTNVKPPANWLGNRDTTTLISGCRNLNLFSKGITGKR